MGTGTDSFFKLGPEQVIRCIERTGLHCNGFQLALNSYENRVYQIGLDNGPAVVAKFYRPERWTDAAILEEHAFTLELQAIDIPVIAPLRIAGETLHHDGPFRFALYPCRPGRAPDLENRQQLQQLGRYIARIHALGSTQKFRHRPALNPTTFGDDACTLLLSEEVIPLELESAYMDIAEILLDEIEARFETTAAKLIRLHGDGHPGNILCHQGSLFIVDFDDARTGPAIQDLWMFLSGDKVQQTSLLHTVLSAYTQFHDFDPHELTLIEPLRTLRIMHHAAWLTRRRNDPAFKAAFPWFNTYHFWQEHIQTLREQADAIHQPPLQWFA
ncbi:serine/threonine protein kinase [Mariprofundus erugo]|uniref:serine/threonine protein kinase n=1 Tax=Mariprofundus erugo TaxID=2528639 RepID=UPI0010FF3C24|nr:serine/threonine protein kinase [Mariprofundus erugo]TLS77337.1 serine/threonine protein kinase [Mariprofundus erugo]